MNAPDHEWKNWGKQPSSAMKHRGDWHDCPYCTHRQQSLYSFIAGFRASDVFNLGFIIIECPKCFQLSFFHAHSDNMETAKAIELDRRINKDPNYLKVPGAREAFLKMLNEVNDEQQLDQLGQTAESNHAPPGRSRRVSILRLRRSTTVHAKRLHCRIFNTSRP